LCRGGCGWNNRPARRSHTRRRNSPGGGRPPHRGRGGRPLLRPGVVAASAGPEALALQQRAYEGTIWIDAGAGGASRVAEEIEDIGTNLAQTVLMLEESERESRSIAERLRREWDKAVAVSSLASWLPREALGIHGTPDIAPLLYGDDIQNLLALADLAWRVSTAGPYLTAHGLGIDVPPGLIPILGSSLAAACSALDEILGDHTGWWSRPPPPGWCPRPRGSKTCCAASTPLPKGADGPSAIAIERVDHDDGSRAWIVEIPGTQVWDPERRDESDRRHVRRGTHWRGELGPDGRRGGGDEDRGHPTDEPVMLVGHSQGGIAAVALASNVAFASRYDIRAVVTAGATVGQFDPPDDTAILSLEHPGDLVPALDGAPNPDRPNWTTVRHDLAASSDPLDRADAKGLVSRHELDGYVRTAARVDGSGDPSIQAWRDAAEPFLAGEGGTSVRTVYGAVRLGSGSPAP